MEKTLKKILSKILGRFKNCNIFFINFCIYGPWMSIYYDRTNYLDLFIKNLAAGDGYVEKTFKKHKENF